MSTHGAKFQSSYRPQLQSPYKDVKKKKWISPHAGFWLRILFVCFPGERVGDVSASTSPPLGPAAARDVAHGVVAWGLVLVRGLDLSWAMWL